MKKNLNVLMAFPVALWLSGCAVGPDYLRPTVDTPMAFKHAAGWKQAEPADHDMLREQWWQLYDDPQLDALVARLMGGNQSLAAAEAQYRQAKALTAGARASFFPSLDANIGVTRSGQGGGDSTVTLPDGSTIQSGGGGGIAKSYNSNLGVSWELDLWGKLRRQLESDRASMEASAADYGGVRLSQISELTQNYLQLRVMDEQIRLLKATVLAYERSLRLTENQYLAGMAPKSDVTQAQTQVKNTQAEAIDLEYQRAQLENAIAVLIGVPPAEFSIDSSDRIPLIPDIPLMLPSALLERRPDIAAAERRVISANAAIGVNKAAYFPALSLTANGGWRSGMLEDWISIPNRFWSIGPAFAMNIFDGGLIRSRVAQAEAGYDQTVADYRQTVLNGLREVEDYLVQLSTLEKESLFRDQALTAARESLRLMENQYRAGTVDYNSVVSVQTSALSSERNVLTLQGSRLTTSVMLIAALGGGWQDDAVAEKESLSPAASQPD